MAKIKFDVSGSDPEKAVSRDFEPPRPGVHLVKVEEINPGFSKGDDGKPDKTRPRLEIVARVEDGVSKGAPLWDYLSFSEASQWKLDQFLQVFGIATAKKRKGEFDTDTIIGEVAKVRVKADSGSEEYRPKVTAWMVAEGDGLEGDGDGDELDLPSDDDDPFGGDDDETATDEAEGGDDDIWGDDDEGGEEEEEAQEPLHYTAEELKGMNMAGLKDLCTDLELKPPAAARASVTKLRPWIFKNQPNKTPPDDEDPF